MIQRRARDIMSRNVITVPEDLPVTELARILSEKNIGGAPVVDRRNHLVGVVSARDIVSHELKVGNQVVSELDYYGRPDLATRGEMAGAGMHIEDYGDSLVRDILSPVVISAGPDATIVEIASLMGVNRIHRVLILDRGEIAGVVSALDLIGLIPDASRSIVGARLEVLWATDLGSDTDHVGGHAIRIARELDARLLVLHVTPNLVSLMRAYGERPELAGLQVGFEELALDRLSDLSRKLLHDLPDHELIGRSGDPAETILAVIRDRRPDYVVIGAQRPAGERLAGLGSVAEKVLVQATTAAVLTVPREH